VLGDQDTATECVTAAVPVPESEMESGEFVALLATETLPVAVPVVDGVNVAVSTVLWPGARISPEDAPDALKPAPEIVTPEIVTLALPAFVSVTDCVPLLDTFTLPKLTDDAFEFRSSVEAVTVSVAALLVALPALLLTVTENCAPAVSAGVV
jgi:hypothetical protein